MKRESEIALKRALRILGEGAILVGIALLLFADVHCESVSSNFARAKVNTTRLRLNEVADALAQYERDHAGAALPGAPGLRALLSERRPDGSPYLTQLRDDAWQRPIEYIQAVAGGEPRWALRSLGPDGLPRTEDDIVLSAPARQAPAR
jgi:hypothetical protein